MAPSLPFDEKTLLSQVAEGDEKAFRILFDRYWDNIYGVAFAFTKSTMIAEELAEDIFLKIWTKKHLLNSIQKFDAYLFRVAKNHIFNELRKKIKEEPFTEHIINFFREIGDSPEQQMIYKDSQRLVNLAVGNLSSQQRLIYQLSREQGLSQDEIAEKLQISKNTVKSHMNKALQSIRHYLLQYSDGNIFIFLIVIGLLDYI
jgi:RNA polymerase sigma-70 factor (ECF subfamily)